MVFRRRRRDVDASSSRKPDDAGNEAGDAATPTGTDESAGAADGSRVAEEDAGDSDTSKPDRSNGPFDASEVDLESARESRIDLGGLLVKGVQSMKIQLQVDKRSGRGTSALLGVEDAAVQLVAVAAPRTSGMWEQSRAEIAVDAQRRGGRAEEGTGPFGTEVRLVVPVKMKDGRQGQQPSRVSGIDGPRWMLRATFLGKAITDAAAFQRMVALVRQVVVVRGDAPMPPGEVIPLTPPARGDGDDDESVPTVTDGAVADERSGDEDAGNQAGGEDAGRGSDTSEAGPR